MSFDLPDAVSIRDVGPRDGLQGAPPVAVADRLALVAGLADAGLQDVEVAAFVSPTAVPAMAGAADLFAVVERDEHVRYWALVPNAEGARRAVAAGADAITVAVSASEAYAERNTRMSVTESVEQVAEIADIAGSRPVDAVVSCAFGSPYDEDIGAFDVAAIVDEVRASGATHVTLADTVGVATPDRIADVVTATGVDVRLHLHDSRGTALTNAFAAMILGVELFDTAVGGFGGSPFARGAGGNLATEDLVHLCDALGVETGISLERLIRTATGVGAMIGRPVPSRITQVLGG